MSGYGYDYSLTPGRPKGWRSLFRNVLMVGAIATISAVSGAVVALDLLGSGSATADRPALVAAPAQPVTLRVARAPSPAQTAPTNAGAAVQTPSAADATASAATASTATAQPLAPASITTTAQAASAAVPTVSAAPLEEPKTLQVPERELTFTKG